MCHGFGYVCTVCVCRWYTIKMIFYASLFRILHGFQLNLGVCGAARIIKNEYISQGTRQHKPKKLTEKGTVSGGPLLQSLALLFKK